MSNLSKKDFAALCGIQTKTLSTYIIRKKVIVELNGFISTKNEVNALFISKCNAEKPQQPLIEKRAVAKKEQPPGLDDQQSDKKDIDEMSLLEIEKEKKKADLKKVEVDTRLSLLKEEKMMGSAIPVDIVKTIVANLSKAFIGEFKNGTDDIMRILVKTKAYDHKEVAEIRGKLSTIINDSMRKSLATAKKELKSVVDNYSETRGVGEHD